MGRKGRASLIGEIYIGPLRLSGLDLAHARDLEAFRSWAVIMSLALNRGSEIQRSSQPIENAHNLDI